MRYELIEYDRAPDEVRQIYDDVRRTLGIQRLPNWIKAMGTNERLLRGNWEKTKSVLVEGQVPHLLKELIIFVISTRRGAPYCAAAHAYSALRLDGSLSYRQLRDLALGSAYDGMPESFRVAIDVVQRAALAPSELTDADFENLRDVGYTDAEIAELLAQADLAVMFNTISCTFKFSIDPDFEALLSERAEDRGPS